MQKKKKKKKKKAEMRLAFATTISEEKATMTVVLKILANQITSVQNGTGYMTLLPYAGLGQISFNIFNFFVILLLTTALK